MYVSVQLRVSASIADKFFTVNSWKIVAVITNHHCNILVVTLKMYKNVQTWTDGLRKAMSSGMMFYSYIL